MSNMWMLLMPSGRRGSRSEARPEETWEGRQERAEEANGRGAEKYYPDGGQRTEQGHIYDPGKAMPSSPVSPGTPQQSEHVATAAMRRMGYLARQHREDGEDTMTVADGRMHGMPNEEMRHMHGAPGMTMKGGHSGGHEKQLIGTIKKLQRRLERLEEGQGEDFAKASGEGIMGKELFKKLPGLAMKAVKVLKNPPKTWDEYEDDPAAIYKMEVGELERAIKEAGKSGEEKSVDKEISHVLAALICLVMADSGEDE